MVLAFIIKVYLDEEDKHELYFIKKVFSERIKTTIIIYQKMY